MSGITNLVSIVGDGVAMGLSEEDVITKVNGIINSKNFSSGSTPFEDYPAGVEMASDEDWIEYNNGG